MDISRQGSIRKSAENLHITPSALTRKIQEFEEELGTTIFERLPQGMRLNAAGELLVRHIQDQLADFERLRSQIADLSGIRRGHVSIACSQAFVDHILPNQIATYRALFPQVSFSVFIRDHSLGINSLKSFEADLALLLDPPQTTDMLELFVSKQPLCAVMNTNHPLAKVDSIRLRNCCEFPIVMPSHTLAIRPLLDKAMYQRQLQPNIPIESSSLEFLRSYIQQENAITFQIMSGVPHSDQRICAKPIDTRDIPPIRIVLGQLKDRSLSIAATKFVDQLSRSWDESLLEI